MRYLGGQISTTYTSKKERNVGEESSETLWKKTEITKLRSEAADGKMKSNRREGWSYPEKTLHTVFILEIWKLHTNLSRFFLGQLEGHDARKGILIPSSKVHAFSRSFLAMSGRHPGRMGCCESPCLNLWRVGGCAYPKYTVNFKK